MGQRPGENRPNLDDVHRRIKKDLPSTIVARLTRHDARIGVLRLRCLAECPENEREWEFGFYSLNASRIVYVVDEDGPIARYGFWYGTLAEHAERGEERFTVEWNRSEDQVWYAILAFSRPIAILPQLAEAEAGATLIGNRC